MSNIIELGPVDFARSLEELKPLVGNYDLIWRLLRANARRKGYTWQQTLSSRLYVRLSKLFNPKKPYFIQRTSDGTLYMGDSRDDYARIWAVDPNYDHAVLDLIRHRVTGMKGDCLDIGTNMGVFSAIIARSMPKNNKIIAFEPLPQTIKRAAATFALNKLDNVRLMQIAVGDEDGELLLNIADGYSAQASAHHIDKAHKDSWSNISVTCRSLDSLSESGVFTDVGFMKVDVEGHELQTLRGGRNLIARQHPGIVFEYNPHTAPYAGWTAPDATAFLKSVAPYVDKTLHDDGRLLDSLPAADEKEVINIYCEVDV